MKKGECYPSGSERYSYYHYEFLYKRGFFSKTLYDEFRSTCTLNFDDSIFCFRVRIDMDKFRNSTSTSVYNIYDKCYKSSNSSNTINTGCLDEEGIKEYLNDKLVREEWNVVSDDFDTGTW